MYLSQLTIRNFRQFGEELQVGFQNGVTALVGRNDSGKSTVIDAIRYTLLTRDQEYIRVQPEDFYIDSAGKQATKIQIQCKLSGLSDGEKGAFAEYLSYDGDDVALFVNWSAQRLSDTPGARRWISVSVTSGKDGAGPALESSVRDLLSSAYLRPLRDAEREMSPGRGSRLSQILANVPDINQGDEFDVGTLPPDPDAVGRLNLLGLSDYFNHSVERHTGVRSAENSINDQYLASLSLRGDQLIGRVSFSEGGTEKARLRQLLERLELSLLDATTKSPCGRYGLGSNNLLFMACELLLLGKESEGLSLLLIEEPEAHLHPQRQLRLMEFLDQAAKGEVEGAEHPVQVILSTHSPNLASKIPLQNLTLLDSGNAFSLSGESTKLDKGDYRFLERFLDVTKANLFFAHGVIIVEGDAEAILIPTLAKLLGTDLTEHGVSIVNVGGTGLRRFSRIFQRSNRNDPQISVPVSCIADMDVMPDCAPEILGLVSGDDDVKWESGRRRWKALRDFPGGDADLSQRRAELCKDDGQLVKTFVADHWTLEYDLAFCGLAEEVYTAASLAKNDDPLNEEKKQQEAVETAAATSFSELDSDSENNEKLCSRIYRMFRKEGASKTIAAQYLAERLVKKAEDGDLDAETLKGKLPRYIVAAIGYVVTPQTPQASEPGDGGDV